jgi:thioredoxin-related protein
MALSNNLFIKIHITMKQTMLLCLAIMLSTCALAQKVKKTKKAKTTATTAVAEVVNNDVIKWYSMQQALELNKKAPRKFIIDVYTDWCGWCKVMDKSTFTDTSVAHLINKYYYAVKFNAEGNDTIAMQGKTFINANYGKRGGTHPLAQSLLSGKMSYPTTVYLDETLGMLSPVAGYLKPEDINPILKYFGTMAYKTQSFEEFKKR